MVCHLLSGCFDKVGVAENINFVHFLLITCDHDFGRFVKNSTSSWNRKTRDAAFVPFSGHPNFCTNISANGFFLSTQCKHEERQGRAQLISLYVSLLVVIERVSMGNELQTCCNVHGTCDVYKISRTPLAYQSWRDAYANSQHFWGVRSSSKQTGCGLPSVKYESQQPDIIRFCSKCLTSHDCEL